MLLTVCLVVGLTELYNYGQKESMEQYFIMIKGKYRLSYIIQYAHYEK